MIAPAGLAFYDGSLFPDWRGSALIGGLGVQSLIRVSFGSFGQPDEVDRWNMDERTRDVAVAPDGAVWLIEDGSPGRLLRLVPRRDAAQNCANTMDCRGDVPTSLVAN